MIQFWSGDVLLLGVTRRNVERLIAGDPIQVQMPSHKSARKVYILFGEDKPAILRLVEEKVGMKIPDVMKREAQEDPS